MGQAALIAGIGERAAALPGLKALFLAGSFGRGDADAVSDVDLIALAEPADHAGLAAAWRELLSSLMPVVHWAERQHPFWLLNAIGEDWTRCDLTLLHPALIAGRARDELRALHDPDALLAALPASRPPATPNAAVIAAAITEFLRVLGLLPVIAHREEWVTGAEGVGHLRRQFTALLLEEVTLPDRGGALHLQRLLPPAQMAMLAALPHPQPNRTEVIAAHRDAARAFLPVARAMAGRHGVAWPDALEAATRRHLQAALGLEI